jgi:hypothetical protein
MRVGWFGPKRSEVWGRKIESWLEKSWVDVWQYREPQPKRWEGCAPEMEGANDIISGAKNVFSFTILGGGVGAWHAEMNAMG